MSFQFDDAIVEKLRSGNRAAEDAVVVAVFGHFVDICRTVRRFVNEGLDSHECEDVAQEFIAMRLPKLLREYKGRCAQDFSKLFYTSLRNFSLDWLRKVVASKTGQGNQISLDAPLSGGEMTLGDLLDEERNPYKPFKGKLLSWEFEELQSDVRNAMRRHVEGDEMKAWVLEANLMSGMTAGEIERMVPDLFPCKVFAAGSVYSLVSRFRNGPELAALAAKWMGGDAWARMR
jgi:hypothetical protein